GDYHEAGPDRHYPPADARAPGCQRVVAGRTHGHGRRMHEEGHARNRTERVTLRLRDWQHAPADLLRRPPPPAEKTLLHSFPFRHRPTNVKRSLTMASSTKMQPLTSIRRHTARAMSSPGRSGICCQERSWVTSAPNRHASPICQISRLACIPLSPSHGVLV